MNSFTSQICLPEVVLKDTLTLPNKGMLQLFVFILICWDFYYTNENISFLLFTGDTCMTVGWGKLRQSIGPVAGTIDINFTENNLHKFDKI